MRKFLIFILAVSLFGTIATAEIAPFEPDIENPALNTSTDAGIDVNSEEARAFYGLPNVSYMPDKTVQGPARIWKSNDSPQWPNPEVETCPDSSLYGQDPYTPNDQWSAGTSDQGAGYVRYEYIYVSGQICDLHWWGLSLFWNGTEWVNCDTELMTFDITFYADSGGVPGSQLCFYNDVIPNMTATPDLYNDNPLYKFDIENLVPCCSVATAWISIEGSSQSTPDCWFLWMGSASGDGASLLDDGVDIGFDDFDLSICLTGTYVPLFGACCNDNSGACVDNVQITQCPFPAARFAPNTLCADLTPACGAAVGACCDDNGNCSQTLEADCVGSWYYDTPCLPNPCPPVPPCTLSCPPGAIQEGESECHYNWDDTTNGGCNSTIPVFSTINAGETVCGTSGTYSVEVSQDSIEIHRDTDWYEIHVTSDAMLIWSGYAEYEFQLIVIDAGSRDCVDYEVLQGTTAPACSTATIAQPVTPGYYWLWAGSALGTMVHCGSPYVANVQLGTAPTGACCVQGNCVATNTQSECIALQGEWYWQEDCSSFNCPIDYCGLGVYTNGPPDGGWLLASQCAPDYPFYGATADDFVLPGSSLMNISHVVSWHLPWTGQSSSPADWDGVNVVIYANNTGTTPNSPGGKPSNADSVCQHTDIITDGVVFDTTLFQGEFMAILDDVDFWRIISPIDVDLMGGVIYWLEVQPIMDYGPNGQVAWYSTTNIVGTNAHMIFPVAGVPNWTRLLDLGSPVDMAFCLYSPDFVPNGRCCYGDNLCADTSLTACNDLGGSWDPNLNCTDNPCPSGGGCDYVIGDVNGSGGFNGLDVTYGVNFFKGGSGPLCPPGCQACPWHYCGDVNGSCGFNGLDITYMVGFLKGGPALVPCGDCPPNP